MIHRSDFLFNDPDDQTGDTENDPLLVSELAELAECENFVRNPVSYYSKMRDQEKFCMRDAERSYYFKRHIIFNSL
jgi:hypothetical protein